MRKRPAPVPVVVSVILISAAAGLAGATAASAAPAAPSAAPATGITVDGSQPGPAYDGVGAISAGGANSRLLIDYPEPERSQILDYLFTPHMGAQNQLLKLEIGGDANSTDGAEPSHEHTQGALDCNGGYEWWMAEQAVARNPGIKLYGLQWAAPGWTGTWTQSDINYLLDWLGCARSHGLTISYLGGWNERNYPSGGQWFISLRNALDAAGYTSTQIVAADGASVGNTNAANAAMKGNATAQRMQPYYYNASDPWQIANDMSSNPQLKNAISVVGGHDTCGYPTTGYTCYATPTARSIGRPLWESEVGGMDANAGAPAMARTINNGYNQASITGYLLWPLIDSMPPGLNYENEGLITADQPWSGNYTVNRMTWAMAQTTQFVQQGWLHVGGANKSLAGGGSYNTYQAPDHSNWSMVAESTEAPSSQPSQTVTVHVTGGLPASDVHVWASNIWSTSQTDYMYQEPDVHPSGGTFTYTIPRGYVVTFTTAGGQGRSWASSPGPDYMHQTSGLLPEQAGSSGDGSEEPALLAAQEGAYEYGPCGDGSPAQDCVQQKAIGVPTRWYPVNSTSNPYAVLGDDWSGGYTVTGDVMFTGSDAGQTAGIIGRFSDQAPGGQPQEFRGYELTLRADGEWWLWKNSVCGCTGTLASGKAAVPAPGTWHTLSLKMNGSALTMSVNGQQVGQATDNDPNYTHGAAGIMTGGWYPVSYRNMSVTW